jgi:hypothetical protein
MTKGISLLLWMSPFLTLGIFFPLGVWFAFFQYQKLRNQSFLIILTQSTIFLLFSILEACSYFGFEWESILFTYFQANPNDFYLLIYWSGLSFLILDWIWLKYSPFSKNFKKQNKRLANQKMTKLRWVLLAWILSVLFSALNIYRDLTSINMGNFLPWDKEKKFAMDFFISISLFYFWFSNGSSYAIFRPFYKSIVWSGFRRRFYLRSILKNHKPSGELLHRIYQSSRKRDFLIPGWGHIYSGDFWKGFPLLFLALILFFFLLTAIFAYTSPLLGIQFLGSWGLKPGIPDKDFFLKASSIYYVMVPVVFLPCLYILSQILLRNSFLTLRSDTNRQKTSFREGFLNYLPLSLLVHLIFVMLILIIPFTLQRKKASDKKKDQASHFQPEKLEFYFIDPNIPEDIKGLNNSVVTGTETVNQDNGEKISNEKIADNGPKKGLIKKIRGKKVPATYSNYISAKMRVPENFLDYWRRAPKPYSSVVAYTITTEGEVIDIEMVEGSTYPDQDLLTLSLIESLGPLISPPTDSKDIRVTELFWNGSLDPDAMPTELQKEMVLHFDGRYMEEIE